MSRVTFDLSRPALLLLTIGAVAGPACATDNGVAGGGAGAETGTGSTAAYATGGTPATGTGGRSGGTGGSRNVGGSIGGAINGYSFVGTVTPAPGANVIPVPSGYPSCATDSCQAAHCVDANTANALISDTQKALLGKCTDGTSYCVPDDFIATLGKFELKTCKSVEGFEGRCISTCIPEVSKLEYALPRDVCAVSEVCAPCFYPWPDQEPVPGGPDGGPPPQPAGPSGETGACSAGVGDAPQESRQLFQSCGSDRGVCVPRSLVPANLLPLLPVEKCTQPDHICAPILKVMDLNNKFPGPCAPQLLPLPPDPNQPAACVPKFIIDYYAVKPEGGDGFASLLGQSNCPLPTDVCAPCTSPDPLVLDHNTHACE